LYEKAKKQIQELETRKEKLTKLIQKLDDPHSEEYQKHFKGTVNKIGVFNTIGRTISAKFGSNNTQNTPPLLDLAEPPKSTT